MKTRSIITHGAVFCLVAFLGFGRTQVSGYEGAPEQRDYYLYDADPGWDNPYLGYFPNPPGEDYESRGSQGSGTYRRYDDGSWGYRNNTTGDGIIMDPGSGEFWVSPR
jgi:hypothetical protein